MCLAEGRLTFICKEDKTLGEAMSLAVNLAFEYGAKRNIDSLCSCFICVQNEQKAEVFRTPLARDPSFC